MRLLTVVAVLLLAPIAAFAHAILLTSQPSDRGSLPAGAQTLVLHFNSRLDHERSRLTLQGTDAQMNLPLRTDAQPDALAANAELSPGTYTLHWQVLAIDGHVTRGDVHFTVTAK